MRDVDDGETLLFEPADQREEPLDVGVGEAARRLVEHHDAGAARQSARDLDELLRRRRQVRDERVGADLGMTELRQRVGSRLTHPPPFDQTLAHRLHAEADVLHHGQMRRERELLVNHRDAGAARIDRLARFVRTAVEAHDPGVRPERARQDGHQCALAGAVLPDQRTHLTRRHVEIDPGDGDRRPERLAHAFHLEARRGGRLVHFSHFERSGLSSSFIAGSSMFSFVAMCTPVSIRFSTFSPLMCPTSVLTAR